MPTFTARIEKHWIMRCVTVPAAVMRQLGGGTRIRVVARYARESVTTTVMPAGRGRGRLIVLMDILRAAKLDTGDRIEVTLLRSAASGEPEVPADLRQALQFRPRAREEFENGPASQRRWIVKYLEDTAHPETCQRHLELVLERLAERAPRRRPNH